MFALIGAGSVLITPVAARRIDRVGPDRISLVSFTVGLGAAVVLAVAAVPALHGAANLALLGAGMLLLDVAVQCGQVANQARIFGLPGEARARRNTAYMTCAFLGGSAGSSVVHSAGSFWAGTFCTGFSLISSLPGLAARKHFPRFLRAFLRLAAGHRDGPKTSSPAGPSARRPGCHG